MKSCLIIISKVAIRLKPVQYLSNAPRPKGRGKGRGKLTLLFFLLIQFTLSAQDFKHQYKSAKEFYDEKKFNFAMDGFKPLMVYDKSNPYTEYASLYYALSAYHEGYYTLAKETLLQVKQLYPQWGQADEVNYWLAAIYFEQGEIFQAMRHLYAMRSPRDLASIERMKNKYLLQIYDEEVSRLVLEEFPGETALLKRIITRKVGRGDYEAAKELIELNGLDEKDFNFPEKKKIVFKEKYRVAALFPFLAATLEPSPGSKRNQATLDLYQGMKLAVDSLNQLGINIELAGYDTERQFEKVEALMALEEMKSVDVLIGPLFTDEMAPAVEFSKKNQVPMVNPVSNSADYLGENPNALLLQPDFATLGTASADALAKLKLKKPCVVLYGETPRDSIMAFSFVKRAGELNITVALTREITRENSSAVYTTLVNPTKFDKFRNPIEFQLKKDSIGSVFVASDDELIFTKVISSVDRRADSVIIIGQDSWIDKPSMDLDKFERLHIMMSSPGYTDVLSPDFQLFRKRYANKFGSMPPNFAKTGFECMMLIGQSLKEYGTDLIQGLKQAGNIPGVLGRAYRFQDSPCNKEVPFVTFQYGELRMLYEIY